MIIRYQIDNLPILTLYSRKEPILEGEVNTWPPRGSSLTLRNGPIEYFTFSNLFDQNATPDMIIVANEVTFSNDAVGFLIERPNIYRVTKSGSTNSYGRTYRTIELSWTDTRRAVPATDPKVTHYILYRKIVGDITNGWEKIATLPSSQLTYIDRDVPLGSEADYIVTHASEYSFNYLYESLLGQPVRAANA